MKRIPNSWPLFWLLALLISLAVGCRLLVADLRSSHGLESIIRYTVRCALPFFLIAFTASSVMTLCPSGATRWLMANRRYFGLAFAFGMTWHLTFVATSMLAFGNRLNALSLAMDCVGLLFLTLMTLTSFRAMARHLGPRRWRHLHKTGAYVIWLLATYIYLEDVRSDRDLLHFVVLSCFVAAWALRIAAWMKKRHTRPSDPNSRAASRTT